MEVAYLLNNKYRVHEVAKDFKKNSKEITDILTKYATAPKNHMQVLEDRELSLIFEYLTQHNQVDNIESIYAEVYREPKTAPAPKGEPAKAAPQAQKPAAPAGRPAPQQPKGCLLYTSAPAPAAPKQGRRSGRPPHGGRGAAGGAPRRQRPGTHPPAEHSPGPAPGRRPWPWR